jgi:hypothetical protein
MGLDNRAKPLSGGSGRRGAASRKKKLVCTIQHRRISPEVKQVEEQEGGSRSDDGESVNVMRTTE